MGPARAPLLVASWALCSLLVACQSAPAPGAACTRDGECAAPLACRFGRCRTGCSADRDCGDGFSCLLDASGLGSCALSTDLGCESGVGRECASGLVCVADRCAQICSGTIPCAVGAACTPAGAGVSFCAPAGTDASVPADAGASEAGPLDGGVLDGSDDGGLPVGAVGTACIGEGFICATRAATGQPYCWGNEAHRALGFDPGATGDGCDGNSPRGSDHPLAVPLMDVDELACGRSWVCAHRRDGTVHCWGDSNLGNIVPSVRSVCERNPQELDRGRVSHPSGHGGLLASTQLACVYSSEGAGLVRCWGGDQGTVHPRDPGDPVIQPLDTIVDLATDTPEPRLPTAFVPVLLAFDDGLGNAYDSFGGGCAADGTGRLACWGATSVGQAGSVSSTPLQTAVLVAGVNDVRSLVRGQGVTCWLDGSGVLSCMGVGSHGELAAPSGTLPDTCARTQTFECSATPIRLASATFSEISANAASVALCGIASGGAGYVAGDVYCWGSGEFVQNGSTTHGAISRPIDGHIRTESGDGLHDAVHVYTGWYAACAIDLGGMLWCWGANTGRALRDPDPARELARAVPLPLP